MIKLVGMDIDNTLTSPDGIVDSNVIGTIQKLYATGIHIALASARPLQGIDAIANLLGIKAHQIANLGAIIRTATAYELQRLTIDLDIARDIARFADENQISVTLNINDIEYHSQNKVRPSMTPQVSIGQAIQALEEGVPPVIIAVPEPISAVRLYEYCLSRYSEELHLNRHVNSNGSYISTLITNSKAQKGLSLLNLCRFLSIPQSETLAVGDSESDISMLGVAGISVAVSNADLIVRNASKYTAPLPYGSGVNWAIENFVL
jgi:HAD superfamily hydrolase (TIGR01484 family)